MQKLVSAVFTDQFKHPFIHVRSEDISFYLKLVVVLNEWNEMIRYSSKALFHKEKKVVVCVWYVSKCLVCIDLIFQSLKGQESVAVSKQCWSHGYFSFCLVFIDFFHADFATAEHAEATV